MYYNYYPHRVDQVFAEINGGPLAPEINGFVTFQQVYNGTMVCAQIEGLPPYQAGQGDGRPIGPHGFHLHENDSCQIGDQQNPFQEAGEHWNPTDQPHGNHAGDFPVLFSNNGFAYICFFTNKFLPTDVIGKAIIIHQSPDDYRTQPAGDAGKRLACGVIQGR
ncbi:MULTISPECIES: superoxide dismutase family protein [Virgibacillus]|uniref:superoxide dismutase family protein n=1 Tax=Virgibacillus TaxID=84406 RepID=UPI0003883540|nr:MULTISPECIES: superoxide dismutase family protein [Virgibacillus]EQB34988.1 hypothetical protein M948_17925 [Virgibacillus sp. CM-4]MYL42898.1 superoxide dismutase family protein [Virgibacillus massiliensis]